MKYYAKSAGGFYDSEINGDNIPNDAVEITTDLWEELLSDQSQGKIITGDESGHPISINRPGPGNDELMKIELTNLSAEYQEDIKNLNIAWLAAAVSDGVGEEIKKTAVINQIELRRSKYTADRAEIIAKYS